MTPKTFAAGLAVAGVLAFVVLFPLVSPWDPDHVDFDLARQLPSVSHPLGTDQFGRDLATRIAIGGRTTLLIAAGALASIIVFGFVWGTAAALAGGAADSFLMRIVDGLLALPRLLVAIIVLVALRLDAATIPGIVFALAVAGWMLTARLVRGHMLSLKSRDFVKASRALGAGWTQIARRHLLPNSAGILLVAVLLELPTVVLGEAFLSVLGLGPTAPTATWGNIAFDGWTSQRMWELTVATLAISVFAISANVLADGLADQLDPRRRAGSAGRPPRPAAGGGR